jgi:hypothetical protein
MIEAFGTSTPTSITVVATRSRVRPRRSRPSRRPSPPAAAGRARARRALERRRERGVALGGGGELDGLRFADERADPVGLPALAERPAQVVDHLVEPVEETSAVFTGLLPGGFSSSTERSMSP